MSIIDAMLKAFTGPSTASTLVFLSVVGVLGIIVGKLRFGSLKLGVAGVLFVGLLVGHLGAHIDHNVLHFVKEFGLILFVYSIGIEIGPRFIGSLRDNGLQLNMFAALIVFLGFLIAFGIKYAFNLDIQVVAGLFSGAVTNTPSLGAVQALLKDLNGGVTTAGETAGMAYAIAYPFGIMGIILVMALIRVIFRIKTEDEMARFKAEMEATTGNVQTVKAKLTNPNLFGKTLADLTSNINKEFVVSRIIRDEENIVPRGKFVLKEGDVFICLCHKEELEEIKLVIGDITLLEKIEVSGSVGVRHITMTNRRIAGKMLGDINLSSMYPANITRIFRGQTEIIPTAETHLEFGDTLRVVGQRDKMDVVAKFLGNSLRDLSHPNLPPLFIGILLGILLGSIPIAIPGLPMPAKLGLAGGPLIIALLLGHKGRIGKFDFYMTPSANYFIRELGIVMFLACVGLGSGKHFWETLINGGYMWMLYAAMITFFPLLIVGVIARLKKVNYLTICGFLAGSMTDPPALEFANNIAPMQAQATAYATVYPLTMFLRILMAQLLVLFLA